jgi:hypothetical protein
VAVDQRADETPLFATLDDGFIALEGAQFGTIDNGLDAVRGEAFEQRHLLEQKGGQFVTGHDGFLPEIGDTRQLLYCCIAQILGYPPNFCSFQTGPRNLEFRHASSRQSEVVSRERAA